MTKEIFSGLHTSKQVIRVVYGRDLGDDSQGLDILNSGIIVGRFYSPQEVTEWFKDNSIKLLPEWQKSYHNSGLNSDSYKKPLVRDVTLDMPYTSQRDNLRSPLGTCNVSSISMVLRHFGAKRKYADKYAQFEDEIEYFMSINGKSRHSHEDLVWASKQYGVDANFRVNRTWDEVRNQIRQGNPVVISGFFTKSGHILVLIGTKGDDFTVNDPYGNYKTRYKDANGKGLLYTIEDLKKVSKNGSKSNTTWAHFYKK